MIQQGPPTKDFLTDIDVLVRERDALRIQCGDLFMAGIGLTAERDEARRQCTEANLRADGWETQAEEYRRKLEESERERRTDRALLDRRENVSAQLEERTRERDEARAIIAKAREAYEEALLRVKHVLWPPSGAPMLGEEPLT